MIYSSCFRIKVQRAPDRKVCIQQNSLAEFSSGSFPESFTGFFIPKFPEINFRKSHKVLWSIYHDNKKTNNPYRVKFSDLYMVTEMFQKTDKASLFTTNITLLHFFDLTIVVILKIEITV